MEVEAKWRARISEGPPDSPWPQQEPRSTWQDSKSAASPEQQDRLAELTLHELALELFALPVKNPVTVNVHVPMSTLLEVDHRAGHLEGIGAIPAQHCRMLAVSGSLRRLNVSPRSDAPLGADPDLEVLPPLVTEEQLALTTAPDQQPDRLHVLAAQTRLRLFGLLGPAGPQDRAEPGHDPCPGPAGRHPYPVLHRHRLQPERGLLRSRPQHGLAHRTDRRLEPHCERPPLSPPQAPGLDPQHRPARLAPLAKPPRPTPTAAPQSGPPHTGYPRPSPCPTPPRCTYPATPTSTNPTRSCSAAAKPARLPQRAIPRSMTTPATAIPENSRPADPHRPCLASLRRFLMVRQGR